MLDNSGGSLVRDRERFLKNHFKKNLLALFKTCKCWRHAACTDKKRKKWKLGPKTKHLRDTSLETSFFQLLHENSPDLYFHKFADGTDSLSLSMFRILNMNIFSFRLESFYPTLSLCGAIAQSHLCIFQPHFLSSFPRDQLIRNKKKIALRSQNILHVLRKRTHYFINDVVGTNCPNHFL